ncbi:sodium channel protein Nach-like [Bicyclus anynana]|uniref:Sodium channel protein Nach-like n=1 Tax=Bicyclus anynana TaxID=110368 RepID=A0A6J1NJH8_BICAN|nr:sodium channel protein Nach-like [Bicyclus anynana]
MFPKRKVNVQRNQDVNHQKEHNNGHKLLSQVLIEKIRDYVVLFLETSTIHGFNHLVNDRRHPCEVILWLIVVMISLYGTISISWMTWTRYQSSPTVISIDRNMYAWNTTFPSTSICPEEKVDLEKLELYLNTSTVEDKEKLKTFITALANATFENFDALPDYKDIEARDYLETLLSLTPPFKPTVSIGAAGVGFGKMVPTITEMGLCYATNSKIAIYNSPEYRKANRWDVIQNKSSSYFVHPLDGEVFAQILNISSYRVYIHSPLEVPDVASKYHHSPSYFYMKIFVTATTVYTSDEAAGLSVAQRRCRFSHENNLKHNSVYSYTMCRIECRIRLCLQYCQCIPHFYRRIGDEKICDVKGLHCLARYKDILINLMHKGGKKVDCECFPICHNVHYSVQSYALQSWILGTNFQWGISTYPRMKYRRDIIFGFTDVLVAVGGMAGLFLGCSVLSFMEILYFMTLRLISYTKTTNK